MEDYLKEIKLTAETDVWALHPVCGHLHPGTIFTKLKEDLFIIKFQNPGLGAQRI